MKKYIAIGHFKGNENMVSVAMKAANEKSFREDLSGNAFVAWAVITEKKMETLKANLEDSFSLFEEAKKLTANFRRWNDLTDYIEQCFDIMEDKMAKAE